MILVVPTTERVTMTGNHLLMTMYGEVRTFGWTAFHQLVLHHYELKQKENEACGEIGTTSYYFCKVTAVSSPTLCGEDNYDAYMPVDIIEIYLVTALKPNFMSNSPESIYYILKIAY